MKEKKTKAIIIVSAGAMQVPAIKIAKEMGFTVIATDRNPDAVGFQYCDHKVILDTKDADGHVRFLVLFFVSFGCRLVPGRAARARRGRYLWNDRTGTGFICGSWG